MNFGTSGFTFNIASVTASTAFSFTQAMTLDNSGNLLVGTTSASATSGLGLKFINNATNPYVAHVITDNTNNTTTYELYSTAAGAFRFFVGGGGTIYATSTSITAISDQSLKTNIKPLETGLAEVMRLQPRRFDWINGDATNVAGFIAQEVETVLPDLVSDFKYNDVETKKAVKMGDMLPTLVKAIQEQQAFIEQLTQRIATLENK
jgi:hypothetical protein